MPRSPLCQLLNIGPVSAEALMKLGITTPEEFLAQDPYEVFYQLKTKIDPTLCRCALASIVGAHKGIKRNLILPEAVKTYQSRHPEIKWETLT